MELPDDVAQGSCDESWCVKYHVWCVSLQDRTSNASYIRTRTQARLSKEFEDRRKRRKTEKRLALECRQLCLTLAFKSEFLERQDQQRLLTTCHAFRSGV